MVIATRSESNLPLTNWRVQGRVSEVRAADLAFNHSEVEKFLGAMGLALDADAIAVLEARTEGWIAAMQLAALSLRSRADPNAFVRQFSGSQRDMMTYLAEQVLRYLPATVQDMLMRASVLDRMCDDLCRALMQPTAAASLPPLRALSDANVFLVPLDEAGHWFRFHQLFAEALRARMDEIDPEQAIESHRSAARWFEAAGLVHEAIQHAVRGREFVHAARLAAEDIAATWSHTSIVAPSAMWVEQLPDEFLTPNKVLVMAKAMSFLRQLQFGQANAWLDLLDRTLDAEPEDESTTIFRARSAMLRGYTVRMLTGDLELAMALSGSALEQMPPQDHVWRGNALMTHASLVLTATNDTRRVYELCNEAGELALEHNNREMYASSLYLGAMCLCYSGRLKLAEATLAKAQRMIGAWNMPKATSRGWRESAEMRLAYERGDLATVEQIAQPALERSLAGADLVGIIVAAIYLTRMHIARGRPHAALRILDAAEAVSVSSPLSRQYIAMLRAEAVAAQGDPMLLKGWLSDLAPMIRSGSARRIPGVHEDLLLRAAHAHFVLGELAPARRILDEYSAQLQITEANDTIIRTLALRALVRDREGDASGALDDLRAALTLGKAEGYVRTFVDGGVRMRNLLLAARARDIEPGYIMKLLHAFAAGESASESAPGIRAGTTGMAQSGTPWIESISAREREVLAELAAGHTNRAIADRLGITLTTVKSHAASIYSKLGVRNRTQAVTRARELGLLG